MAPSRHFGRIHADKNTSLSLGQAALIAGFGLLAMVIAAPYAELYVSPKLIITENPAETVENITAHRGLYISAIFAYLITFVADIVVAWALYVLLAPVHRQMSLLTAWFRVVYAVISFCALAHYITVFKLVDNPSFLSILGTDQLHAQIKMSYAQFSYMWSAGFFIFSSYLVLLGYLVFNSGYIPKILGILLVINGLGYLVDTLRPFLFPGFDTGFLMVTFFGEVIFMLWLLIRGWKLREPTVPTGE